MNNLRNPPRNIHPNQNNQHPDQRTPLQHRIQKAYAQDNLDGRVQYDLQEVPGGCYGVEVGGDEVVEAAFERGGAGPFLFLGRRVCFFLCITVRGGGGGGGCGACCGVLDADTQCVFKDQLRQDRFSLD